MSGLDTSVPQWLQQASSWYSSDQRLHENAMFNVQMQQAKLQTIQQQEQLKNQIVTNDRISKDLTDIPQWMRDHPTWQSRQDAPWPTALTPQGDRMLQEQRLRDSQSIQAEVATIATHSFASRVAELNKVDPESAGQFYPYISQRPSPDILRALSVAEQAAKLHQENVAEAARLDAEASGAQAKTVIGPKGTTTTYTPPKPGEDITIQPKTLDLGNGTKIAWMPGGKTLHVIKQDGTKQEYTASQMQAISKGLEDDDPRKKQINDFLAETAVRQTGTSSPPAAPTSPTQSQPIKKPASDPLGLFK